MAKIELDCGGHKQIYVVLDELLKKLADVSLLLASKYRIVIQLGGRSKEVKYNKISQLVTTSV